jgi:hypothetical protein
MTTFSGDGRFHVPVYHSVLMLVLLEMLVTFVDKWQRGLLPSVPI